MINRVLISVLSAAFCIAATIWCVTVSVEAYRDTQSQFVAARLMDGQRYSPEALASAVPSEPTEQNFLQTCSPLTLRSQAIIKLALVETAQAKNLPVLWDGARAAVERALACSPVDGYLWLAQFRLAAGPALSGLHLDYLAMSFRLAPNEGWVMYRRLGLAAHYWEQLPEQLKRSAQRDFNTFAVHQRWPLLLSLLDRVNPQLQQDLLSGAEALPAARLDSFARALSAGDRLYPMVPWYVQRYCPTQAGRQDVRCAAYPAARPPG